VTGGVRIRHDFSQDCALGARQHKAYSDRSRPDSQSGLAEVCTVEWYKSKKGWVSAVGGVAYFVLDHWGRFHAAKEIWHLLKPLPWSAISQWIPIFLFALALVFFEVDRRKTKQSPLVIHYAGSLLSG
jgi:hypothetical protein